MHKESLRAAESEIRDITNWVKVFEEEYDLPKEVVETLCTRLEKLAKTISTMQE